MKFKTELIEFKSDDTYYRDRELSYRLKLVIENDELILIKEYFKIGYNDNEKWDKFWIYNSNTELVWVSIITRRFNDVVYMKELETKIFELFYDESYKLSTQMQKDIISYTNRMNKHIKKQQEVTKFVDKFNRRRKLITINKK